MKFVVIDGQGGGFGRALISALRAEGIGCEIIAVGTNSVATVAMLKAGATAGATGENAVLVNVANATVVAGPLGLIMANSMLGECTPAMACAVAQSSAKKVLIPVSTCGVQIAGLPEKTLGATITDAVALLKPLLC